MISNDIGENAREAISFQILEKLFDLETTFTEPVFLASNPEAGFGLPTHCEDVLLQIVKKMHGTNLQDESEELKWNVQSIIMHNRSRLPKCALQKLNDAIHEDKHPSLAFLKQRSGLIISGKLETRIHRNDGDCNTNAQTTIYRCHTYPYSNPYKKAKLFPEVPQLVEDKSGTKDEEVEGQKGPIFYHAATDEYQKERSYIATKKQDFLNYVCEGRGNRSSSMTYRKEANLCMKCEKGGGDPLLVCSSDACPFVFHDSCLVSTTINSDKSTPTFYCPFCRYSRLVTKFHVDEENASLARNDLLLFFKG